MAARGFLPPLLAGDSMLKTQELNAAMTRSNFTHFALILALAALLAGCWVPERYTTRIKIERDGTYKVHLEGTAVHPESYRAMKRLEAEVARTPFKPEELKKRQVAALEPLMKAIADLKGDKRIDYVTSIGDGRVRFSLDGVWVLNRNVLVSSELATPIDYSVAADGTMRLRVKDAIVGAEARALGLQTDGSLTVTLAEGVEVLEHNAQKAPSSHLGSYRWSVGPGATQAPYLKIRLPAVEAKDAEPAGQPHAPAAQKGLAHH